MKLVEAMQYLYEHEINCQVSSFWDSGFSVELGDHMNGFTHDAVFEAHELEQAGDWLVGMAKSEYPNVNWRPL